MIASNYDLTWSCDARADSVTDDMLALMYKAGCRAIWYGMESGNPDILSAYRKKLTLGDLERAATLTAKNNIKVSGSFIIGGPRETSQTIRDTIKFAKKIPLDYFVPFYYTPVPGTPDYPSIENHGYANLEFSAATMTEPTFIPNGMTKSQIKYWYLRSMIEFYMRPRILRNIARSHGYVNLVKDGLFYLAKSVISILGLRWRSNGTRGD